MTGHYRIYLSARPRTRSEMWEHLGYVDVTGDNEHVACERAKVQAIAKWHGNYTELSISGIKFLREIPLPFRS